jgi:hypothetical protein
VVWTGPPYSCRYRPKPKTGTYRMAYRQSVRGGFRVSRADAAHFMLRVLQQQETVGHSIAIAY